MSTRIQESINKWLFSIQRCLLPPVCVLCRQPADNDTDLCLACQSSLPRIPRPCQRCAQPLPPGEFAQPFCGTCLYCPPAYTRMVAPFNYQPPLTTLVAGFKYHDRLVNGRILVNSFIDALNQAYSPMDLPGLLLPVPLHKKRLRQRGYNQSRELARWLSQETGTPLAQPLIVRAKHTPHQTGLSAAQRKRNLQGAFVRNPALVIPDDITIAIVDDVVTTGSTVNQLARILLKAGAREVHVWALARTVV